MDALSRMVVTEEKPLPGMDADDAPEGARPRGGEPVAVFVESPGIIEKVTPGVKCSCRGTGVPDPEGSAPSRQAREGKRESTKRAAPKAALRTVRDTLYSLSLAMDDCTSAADFASAACFVGIELDLDDLLDPLLAQLHRHAHERVLHPVFALEKSGAGKDRFLSFTIDSTMATVADEGA